MNKVWRVQILLGLTSCVGLRIKSPELDGYLTAFFRKFSDQLATVSFWRIPFAQDLTSNYTSGRYFCDSQKGKNPLEYNVFCPISFLNTDAKILDKSWHVDWRVFFLPFFHLTKQAYIKNRFSMLDAFLTFFIAPLHQVCPRSYSHLIYLKGWSGAIFLAHWKSSDLAIRSYRGLNYCIHLQWLLFILIIIYPLSLSFNEAQDRNFPCQHFFSRLQWNL